MCYRDRTYCQGPCATADCSRQITPEVETAAQFAGLPLAISDLRDGCSRYTVSVVSPRAASPRSDRDEKES